ncbi:MAG: (d)CMP kinase [Clostridiales bacterium]|nr:(d)CMP kinase [Clostridiales bacterium]
MINIAIDGPSGSGKSTLAKEIAKRLGYIYVDTGALYRSIGLYIKEHQIDPKQKEAVIAALPNIHLELTYEEGKQTVYVNGVNVGDRIRTPEIAEITSTVASIPEIRSFLLSLQKDMAARHDVVMDGRDIGTVILPDAQVKIYLSASAENRAERRYKELRAKGIEITREEVKADLIKRDHADETRETAPAVAAKDAIPLDNSALNLEQTFEAAMEIIRKKLNEILPNRI